jgi:hypothetical protein
MSTPSTNPFAALIQPVADIINATTIKTDVSIDEKSTKTLKILVGVLAGALILSAIIKAKK